MIDHEQGQPLIHEAYARVFRDVLTDELMVLLDASLLMGSHGIAVIGAASSCTCSGAFQDIRMLELRSVIRKDKREHLPEDTQPKEVLKIVDDFCHAVLSLAVHKECQHQLGLPEIECQKDPPTFDRLNDIHLHHGGIRVGFHVGREVRIGPSYAISLIKRCLVLLSALLVADLARKIDVPEGEQRKIAVGVEGALGDPQSLPVRAVDMVDGLTPLDERSQQFIQKRNLVLGGIDALPGGDERLLVSLLGRQCPVVIPVCRAALLLFACVADVWDPDELLADERDEVRAKIAAIALLAEFPAVLLLADILLYAGLRRLAVIRYVVEDCCLAEYPTSSDFLGYGSRISVQGISYLLDGQPLIESCLNILPVFYHHVFMLPSSSCVESDLISHYRYPPDVLGSDILFIIMACLFPLQD